MNPNNISDIKNLSELQSNGSDIVYKSTKINLENNSYESSIHKLSKNKWTDLKKSTNWNFSIPKYSKNNKLISFVKTPKSSEILDSLEKKKNSSKTKLIYQVFHYYPFFFVLLPRDKFEYNLLSNQHYFF